MFPLHRVNLSAFRLAHSFCGFYHRQWKLRTSFFYGWWRWEIKISNEHEWHHPMSCGARTFLKPQRRSWRKHPAKSERLMLADWDINQTPKRTIDSNDRHLFTAHFGLAIFFNTALINKLYWRFTHSTNEIEDEEHILDETCTAI